MESGFLTTLSLVSVVVISIYTIMVLIGIASHLTSYSMRGVPLKISKFTILFILSGSIPLLYLVNSTTN